MKVSIWNAEKIGSAMMIFAALIFVAESRANTFHVSHTGADTETCGSLSEPCRSVAYVTETLLHDGDEILVGAEAHDGIEVAQEEVAATEPADTAEAETVAQENNPEIGSESASPENPIEPPVVRQPASVNLLANPGFERGMSKWSDWGSNRIEGFDGNHVLRTGPHPGGAGQMLGNVKPGKTYVMTVQAKVGSGEEAGALVGMTFYDAMGRRIGAEFSVAVRSTEPAPHTVQVTAPANAAMVQVWAWKEMGPSELWVDEFTLSELRP